MNKKLEHEIKHSDERFIAEGIETGAAIFLVIMVLVFVVVLAFAIL